MLDYDFDEDGAQADGPTGRKIYLTKTVLQAAKERMTWIFDTFTNVVVSVSGGKDSSVLADLAQQEAERRSRVLNVFFLDQEAEYQSSIDIVRYIMAKPNVKPWWFQCPYKMTNATSYEDEMLYAWEPGTEWMRAKEDFAIHDRPTGAPDRFYPFIDWFESQWGADTCFLVGLRSEESLNRYGAVTRNPAIPGVNWSSKATKSEAVKLYPLYDWTFEDVWTYFGDTGIPYNKVYDWMWVKGFNIQEMRVSNLIHERAFKSLATLQEFEPDTYDRLQRRLKGVHTAAIYAKEQTVYATDKRPDRFKTWLAYRDFLLETLPNGKRQTFLSRFAGQKQNETVYRQQCRQLLLNDWENNVPVVQMDQRINPLEKWKELL